MSSAVLNGSTPSAVLQPGNDDREAQRVEPGIEERQIVGEWLQKLALSCCNLIHLSQNFGSNRLGTYRRVRHLS